MGEQPGHVHYLEG